MQFSDIRTRCATRFRDTGFVIVTDAQWGKYVNDAYADVQAAVPNWPWFEATTTLSVTAATNSKALPTDVFSVRAVLNQTDDIRMRPYEGSSEHYANDPEESQTGPPTQYRVSGTTLYVYPTPTVTTSLRIDYDVADAELSADADLPAFPAEFHRMLVEGAMARAYVDDANIQQAQAHDAAFTALLGQLKDRMLGPDQERYHEIVDTWWG